MKRLQEPMEKEKKKGGSLKAECFERVLPSWRRFLPTDEELIMKYLIKKVMGEKLPAPKIHEEDLYNSCPEELIGKHKLYKEEEWYFFCSRNREYPKDKRPGFWRSTGSAKNIEHAGNVIGIRTTLDYKLGTPKKSRDTEWKMHEFVLKDGGILPGDIKGKDKLTKWVLCKIYKKKKSESNNDDVKVEGREEGPKVQAANLQHNNDGFAHSGPLVESRIDVHGVSTFAFSRTATYRNPNHVIIHSNNPISLAYDQPMMPGSGTLHQVPAPSVMSAPPPVSYQKEIQHLGPLVIDIDGGSSSTFSKTATSGSPNPDIIYNNEPLSLACDHPMMPRSRIPHQVPPPYDRSATPVSYQNGVQQFGPLVVDIDGGSTSTFSKTATSRNPNPDIIYNNGPLFLACNHPMMPRSRIPHQVPPPFDRSATPVSYQNGVRQLGSLVVDIDGCSTSTFSKIATSRNPNPGIIYDNKPLSLACNHPMMPRSRIPHQVPPPYVRSATQVSYLQNGVQPPGENGFHDKKEDEDFEDFCNNLEAVVNLETLSFVKGQNKQF